MKSSRAKNRKEAEEYRKEAEEFVDDLLESARTDLMPQMKDATFVVGVMRNPDVYLALQIGLALTLDKPLILLVPAGAWISPRLRSIAHAIIEGDLTAQATSDKLRAVFADFVKGMTPQ
jgi:hypothetical protein